MTEIDADDLALLAGGFEAALRDAASPTAAITAIHDLGWIELLEADPAAALTTAFTPLGTTGSAAGLVDDVATWALGRPSSTRTAVLFPRPGGAAPPARLTGDSIVVDGVVSSRVDDATEVLLVCARGGHCDLLQLEPTSLAGAATPGLDPVPSYHRIRAEVAASATTSLAADVDEQWRAVVDGCRVALAHELAAAARVMLGFSRDHAVDREQFGRPVASFQALRHKLAEAFALIEGATAAAAVWAPGSDPLLAAVAKSLAGQAARTAATHAQQVLAGIGFTAEHAFHTYLKRTLVLDQLLGSATTLPTEIGRQLLARGGAPRLVEL